MNKTRSKRVRTHYVRTEDDRLVLVPGDPTRSQIVAGWIVWHSREVAGVLVPAGFAVAVTPWAWLASGAVAAGWTVYEVWQAREQAGIKAGRDLPAVIGAASDPEVPVYQVCVECGHEYATAADLLAAHNKMLTADGLERESDVAQVVTCPMCLHDFAFPPVIDTAGLPAAESDVDSVGDETPVAHSLVTADAAVDGVEVWL